MSCIRFEIDSKGPEQSREINTVYWDTASTKELKLAPEPPLLLLCLFLQGWVDDMLVPELAKTYIMSKNIGRGGISCSGGGSLTA